jgi:hypothetical protein
MTCVATEVDGVATVTVTLIAEIEVAHEPVPVTLTGSPVEILLPAGKICVALVV